MGSNIWKTSLAGSGKVNKGREYACYWCMQNNVCWPRAMKEDTTVTGTTLEMYIFINVTIRYQVSCPPAHLAGTRRTWIRPVFFRGTVSLCFYSGAIHSTTKLLSTIIFDSTLVIIVVMSSVVGSSRLLSHLSKKPAIVAASAATVCYSPVRSLMVTKPVQTLSYSGELRRG